MENNLKVLEDEFLFSYEKNLLELGTVICW